MPNKTLTQVPVAAKHIIRVVLEPETIVGEVVTWKATYDYSPADVSGASIRGTPKSRLLPLGAQAQLTLQNFVTNQLVPDANAAEGT